METTPWPGTRGQRLTQALRRRYAVATNVGGRGANVRGDIMMGDGGATILNRSGNEEESGCKLMKTGEVGWVFEAMIGSG